MARADEVALLETAEALHKKINRQARGSAAAALAAGRALLAAKAAAPGKGWLAALKSHTSMTPRSVQRYMLLARATDGGMLGEGIEELSFSQAYRLAVRLAVRVARKSAGASRTGNPTVAAGGRPNPALKVFREAVREAMAAGVPFKILERELAERAGAQLLKGTSAAGERARAEDEFGR